MSVKNVRIASPKITQSNSLMANSTQHLLISGLPGSLSTCSLLRYVILNGFRLSSKVPDAKLAFLKNRCTSRCRKSQSTGRRLFELGQKLPPFPVIPFEQYVSLWYSISLELFNIVPRSLKHMCFKVFTARC